MNSVLNIESKQCPESKLGQVHSAPTLSNSVPNSDSKQCPESKLGQVYSTPTLSPACARTKHCCRPGPAVSRVVSPRPRACCCSYRSSLHRIVALPPAVSRLCCNTTQWPSRLPVPIQFIISRHTPPAAKPSHARRSLLRAGRSCRWPSPRPYRGPIRPCPSRDWPCRGPWVSTHAYCLQRLFFFFHIIFFLSTYWKTIKKQKKKFHFLVEQNKFLKIYFIFFQFYTL